MTDPDDGAPGWDAINAALARLYPGVEPLHLGTLISWRLGGPDPLDGISIYRREDHWHYVSFGMSDLYGEEPGSAESGWGFEFTFRLARAADETEPPNWAANFLQNLARYVFSSGNPFAAGHHVDLNGPIAQSQQDTAIRAIGFVADPELDPVDSPQGTIQFLQVVGLTLAEYAATGEWDTLGLLDLLRRRSPLLITDLARTSITADPQLAAAIEEGIARDGSSTGTLYVSEARWRTEGSGTVLTFGANAAERIGRTLAGRLPFGLGLAIDSAGGGILFRPGDETTVTDLGDDVLEIALPVDLCGPLSDVLRPVAGRYPFPGVPGLTLEIVRSQIRDQAGNVVQEIG